jgi:hypothetical protein
VVVPPPGPLGRDERRAARARAARLSRLPPLYEFSLRGRWQAIVATLVQAALAVALALVPAKLATGSWLPPGAALLVLASAFGLQFLSRYLNAQAGRR